MSRHGKDASPPTEESHLGGAPQELGDAPGTRLGEQQHEVERFFTPPAAHFEAHDDQPASAAFYKLWVSGSFSAARSSKVGSIFLGRSRMGTAIATNWGHQGGVDGELDSTPKGEAIGNNLQLSPIVDEAFKVQVAHEDVRGHASACFPTHSRDSSLQGSAPLFENSSRRTRSAVVTLGIQEMATPASACRERERQPQAPEEQGAELIRRDLG